MTKTSPRKCIGAVAALAILFVASGRVVKADHVDRYIVPMRTISSKLSIYPQWEFPGLIARNIRLPAVCAEGYKVGSSSPCRQATINAGCTVESVFFMDLLLSRMNKRYFDVLLGRSGSVPSGLIRFVGLGMRYGPEEKKQVVIDVFNLKNELGSEEFAKRSQAAKDQVMREFAPDVERVVKEQNLCTRNLNALAR